MLRLLWGPFFAIFLMKAFCTEGWAFGGDVHNAMTRSVIMDQKIHYGGVEIEPSFKLFDEINWGNLKADAWDGKYETATDKFDITAGEGENPAAHMDAESFQAASARIVQWVDLAAQYLSNCERTKARHSIGRAFHPVEDFFSHSNFIEIEEATSQTYPIDFFNLKAPNPELKCNGKTHMTNLPGLEGLTSGYFSLTDDYWKPPKKCSHFELNKDYADLKGKKITSPEEKAKLTHWHQHAVARATAETKKFFARVLEELTHKTDRVFVLYLLDDSLGCPHETTAAHAPEAPAADKPKRDTSDLPDGGVPQDE